MACSTPGGVFAFVHEEAALDFLIFVDLEHSPHGISDALRACWQGRSEVLGSYVRQGSR